MKGTTECSAHFTRGEPAHDVDASHNDGHREGKNVPYKWKVEEVEEVEKWKKWE